MRVFLDLVGIDTRLQETRIDLITQNAILSKERYGMRNIWNGIMLLITLTAMISAHNSHAKEINLPKQTIVNAIYKAAKAYKIDAQDLVKIAYLESTFKSKAKRFNKNGTIDAGMFQINSVHWTTTCKKYDISKLQGNAYCAAKLISLAKRHAKHDKNWLGRYHSKTPKHKRSYAKVLASLEIAGRE